MGQVDATRGGALSAAQPRPCEAFAPEVLRWRCVDPPRLPHVSADSVGANGSLPRSGDNRGPPASVPATSARPPRLVSRGRRLARQ